MDLERRNFLGNFQKHLLRIKPFTTKDELLNKMQNKECLFTGLLDHFKGDTVFRECRHYLMEKRDRELVRQMLTIINETL